MNSKRVSFIGATVCGCALLFLASEAPAFQKDHSRVVTARPRSEDLYRANCARCHGAEGRGDTPLGKTYKAPDLTDGEWWQQNPELTRTRNLISIVTKGKGGMPAFGKKLRRTEITLLVKHMRRFRKPAGKKGSP